MKRHPALVPLSREHNTALIVAFHLSQSIPTAEPEQVRSAYDVLIDLWARGLLPHFRAENECLLARLIRHVPDSSELITRTQRDHLGIEALVADMRDNPDIEVRRRLLLAFAERLRTHIRWEEDVLFETSQATLTDGELSSLARDVSERVGEGKTGAPEVSAWVRR